jgi:tetratricopeptide (TPR) repeat protein
MTTAWTRWFTRETMLLWCVLAIASLEYLSLDNGFILDDVAMIVNNPDLRNWSFLWKGFTRNEFWYTDAAFLQSYQFRNYRPLLLVFYWIDYHLFGLNPIAWHASVLAVQLIVVWLVFKISRRLAGNSIAALLAASLFALTPVHIAAVVWMAGSGYVLASAFLLGAFYLIMPREVGTVRNWASAIVLYACALLSHESAAALPGLVACYAFFYYGHDLDADETVESNAVSLWDRASRAVIWQAPFAAVLLLYMVTRRLVLGFFVSNPYYNVNLLTKAQSVFTTPLVLGKYLIDLAMPWLTLPNHRVMPVSSPLSHDFWVPLTAIALAMVTFLFIAMRSRRHRLYLFCGSWIAITLTPMMLLHSMPHLVQDYYLYLPSVGWCLLVGDLIAVFSRRNMLARRIAFGGASALLLIYAVALWKVEWFWHDDVAAATAYVDGFPESVGWHLTLATYLDRAGRMDRAEQEVRIALSRLPDRTGLIYPHSRELHLYLGELLARRGDIDGAESEFKKAASDTKDESPPISEAEFEYEREGVGLYNRALHDARFGHLDQGIEEYTHALEVMSKHPTPKFGLLAMRYGRLAELYDSDGKPQQAEAVLKEMDSMSGGELAVGLAEAAIRLQHADEQGAERILRDLSQRYASSPGVLIQLGDVQTDLKQNEDALATYQLASVGALGDSHLHLSQAKALHALGRDREAVDQCRLALVLAEPQDLKTQVTCAQIRSAVENQQSN